MSGTFESAFSGRLDTAFRGAEIYDGSGGDPYIGDVGICDDQIVAAGDLAGLSADREIDAAGLTLAPGFIDVHTHDDRYLLTDSAMTPKVSQGVTTVVTGNCGFSLAPCNGLDPTQFPYNLWLDRAEYRFNSLDDYFDALAQSPPAVNCVTLVGHSSLRYGAMADLKRTAKDSEINAMQQALRAAMQAGAIGMSSGLFYPPAAAATAEEVAAIAEAMAPFDGIYTAHIRDEAENLLEAVEEAAEIAHAAGVQLVISHHKASGLENFGLTRQSLPLIAKLQRRQRLSLDVYPYIASSTMLLPDLVERCEKVLITWSQQRPDIAGADLRDLAEEMGLGLRAAAEQLTPAGAVYFQMHEEDVSRVIAFPSAMIGSDGIPDDPHPHPRLWGTFARVLGHYVREVGLLSLAEAVHRMSGLPAQEFGLKGRGRIAAGQFADLVLFNKTTIKDAASFSEPKVPAIGISQVMVNGQIAWKDGANTNARAGRALRLADTTRSSGE